MRPEHLTAALIHLSMAFDPKETPQGAAFWLDVRRRLIDYHTKALNPAHALGNHAGAVAPTRARFPDFPSLNLDYAKCAGNSIDNAFTWDSTQEGDLYWGGIAYILRNYNPASDPAILDKQEGKYVGHFDEKIRLKAHGLERPDFAEELWYRPGQWPHHDPENRQLIRYIPLGKPALSKYFVSAKPGKFLAAHYGEALTEPLIADLAAKFRTVAEPPPLLLARTADEIAHVYANGPSSCMSGGKKVDGVESVRAYASPDLAIAYFKRNDAITARALVCPERKVHSRIYGDITAFETVLSRAGYKNIYSAAKTQDFKAFDGLRLAPLRAKGWRPAHKTYEDAEEPVLIAPYFDCGRAAWWDGEYLRIGDTPPSKASHKLLGGYTIPAIPAEGPIPPYPNSPREYMTAIIGSQGNNTRQLLSFREAGRDPVRSMTDAAKEALVAKQAREAQRIQAEINNLQNALNREVEAHRQQQALAQLAAYPQQVPFGPRGF